ncbi:MAG: HNH endonuclease signature motif containing protein [Verrucomicrobiia bacterium]|jgi:predicted restriction endonuclease
MPFVRKVKFRIVKKDGKYLPCVMCGRTFPPPDAAHIIEEKEWKQKKGDDAEVNGLPLCKTCHTVFDDYLRSRLYQALKDFGVEGLPRSWKMSAKKQIK